MLGVGLPSDPWSYIGGFLALGAYLLGVIALRPGWRFHRWRRPTVGRALRALFFSNRMLLAAAALGVVSLLALAFAPEPLRIPRDLVAQGSAGGVDWALMVTEGENYTCLLLRSTILPANEPQVCGRPRQPRTTLSAVRLALRTLPENSLSKEIHFIVGTTPPGTTVLEVTAGGSPLSLPKAMLVRLDRYPYRFFIVTYRRTSARQW